MHLFSRLFFLTLIMTMWDSSRISRKLGFRTDKLMLGTARQHARRWDTLTSYSENKNITAQWLCWSYVWDWYDLRYSTGSSASPLNRDYRSPPPVPSPWTETKPELFFIFPYLKKKTFWGKLERSLLLPLWESLARGEEHTTCSFVQEADFATQNLHKVAFLATTHLHPPEVVGITCAILRKDISSESNK